MARPLLLLLVLNLLGGCSDSSPGATVDARADGSVDASVDAPSMDSAPVDLAADDGALDAAVDSSEDAAADASADEAVDAAPRLGPPYPIVLAHGFFGFEDFAGAGFVDYFWRVRERLEDEGELLVTTPAVDPFNNSTVRGEELLAHVESVLADSGHEKVVIIGHSQGGLDARYVAHNRPDLLAAVVTVATPHRGTPLLDFVIDAAGDSALSDLIDDLVRLFGAALYDAAGEETSLFMAMRQLSESGAAEFSDRYPDDPAVDYFSIGGRSGSTLALRSCGADIDEPDFISDWDLTVDPIDPLLAVSEALYDGNIFDPEPNDGLVRVSSSRWGTFLGCIPADHLDQIGHLLGDEPGLLNFWDHRDFYADLVSWLRERGY
ncbi:MAG: alpha/beta fold hydrolase [Myxococcota bacterium]